MVSVRRFDADLLTEDQRRHLVASLANVAAALGEIEAIAKRAGRTPQDPLIRVASDLPLGFHQTIDRHLVRARAALADLGVAFDLEARSASANRAVQALVMASLVALEDTGPRNLRGYGAIHPSLPDLLEPALARIHDEIRAIGDALTGRPGHPTDSEGRAP